MALPSFISVINSASRIGCITSKIDNRQVLHMGQGMITFPGVCPLALCRSCYQCFFFYLFHSVYSISFDGMVVCNRCIYFFFFFVFAWYVKIWIPLSITCTCKYIWTINSEKLALHISGQNCNIYLFFKYIYNVFILFFILSYNILVTIKWHL